MSNEQKQPQEGNLTAEEINNAANKHSHQELPFFDPDRNYFKQLIENAEISFKKGVEFATQQTAEFRKKLSVYESGGHTLIPTTELIALREELEKVKKERNRALDDFSSLQFSSVQAARKHLKDLEAVKKERDELDKELKYDRKVAYETSKKNADMIIQLSEVTRQRDETVRLLDKLVAINERSDDHVVSDIYHFIVNDYRLFQDRLHEFSINSSQEDDA